MAYSCRSVDGTAGWSGDEKQGKSRDEWPSKAYQRIQPLIKRMRIRLKENDPEGIHRHAERPPRIRLHETTSEVSTCAE